MLNKSGLFAFEGRSIIRSIFTSGLIAITVLALGGPLSLDLLIAAHAWTGFARQSDQAADSGTTLTYVAGSSVKLQQINGDCDWVTWDATNNQLMPTCNRTVSQTATKADILGDDVASSFEHNGELIMMFGDTIGTDNYYPAWVNFQNPFKWNAHDPIARSTTQHAEDGLLLDFFMDGSHGLEVQPNAQPDGTAVNMAVDNVPEAGISLDGQIYISCKTGTVDMGGNIDNSHAYSVLVKFDETSQAFTSGRTISKLPGGRFVHTGFYEAPAGILGTPPPVQPEPVVTIFGLSEYRASNVYLSVIPKSEFESGLDPGGNSATRYFTGLAQGKPGWSANEADSVPVVNDIDPANPTIGNFSVLYSQQLGLWLMTFDGGRGSSSTTGVYFTYAQQPWGPWSTPQLIFNDCRDKGFGNFIYYYYKTDTGNNCPSAMPAGANPAPNHAGPSGPTIGDQTKNDPATTRGGAYAPLMIERFTTITGSKLKIYYTLSTWNPYAVVLMESDFNITQPPDFSLGFNQSAVTVSAPGKVAVTLNINRTGGFNGNVAVAPISAVLPGIRFPGVPSSTTGNSVPFKIKVKGNVPHGTYPINFAGKDDTGRERDATLTLQVQ
jgi:hypothetical protein